MEKGREVGIEPTETVPTRPAAFDAIRAVTMLLARDAHPFALTLLCFRGRGLTGSRLRLHTLAGMQAGWCWVSTRGITKPPRVWHYEGGDFHIVDLYLLVITCAPIRTQGYQVEHRSEGAFPRAIPMVFVCSLFIFSWVLGR